MKNLTCCLILHKNISKTVLVLSRVWDKDKFHWKVSNPWSSDFAVWCSTTEPRRLQWIRSWLGSYVTAYCEHQKWIRSIVWVNWIKKMVNFTFKLGCQLRESCYSVIFTKKSWIVELYVHVAHYSHDPCINPVVNTHILLASNKYFCSSAQTAENRWHQFWSFFHFSFAVLSPSSLWGINGTSVKR